MHPLSAKLVHFVHSLSAKMLCLSAQKTINSLPYRLTLHRKILKHTHFEPIQQKITTFLRISNKFTTFAAY